MSHLTCGSVSLEALLKGLCPLSPFQKLLAQAKELSTKQIEPMAQVIKSYGYAV